MRRRTVLQGLLLAAAMPAGALLSKARATPGAGTLVVFDDRYPASRELANGATSRLELGAERGTRWKRLRELRHAGAIVGLTLWSDHLQVRAALESTGKRVRRIQRVGSLFYWEMA